MNTLRETQLAICPPTHNLMDVPDEVCTYQYYIFRYHSRGKYVKINSNAYNKSCLTKNYNLFLM